MPETLRERRARLRQEGKCTRHCDRPVEVGFLSCRECVDKEKLRSQKRYRSAKDANKCTKHKDRDAAPGHSYCDECLLRAQQQNTRIKENGHLNGMCTKHPFRPVLVGYFLCEDCVKDRREIHHTRKEQGVCVKHAFRKAIYGLNCEECWFRNISSGAFGTPTRWQELQATLVAQKHLCAYTGVLLIPGINASIDHKVPRAIGKNNELSNLHWIDLKVNCSKRDIPHDQFLQIIEVIHNRCNLGISASLFLEKKEVQIHSNHCKSHRDRLAKINSLCFECWLKQAASNAGLTPDKHEALCFLLDGQRSLCPYTGILLVPGSNAALDHIIPRAHSGPDDISNLQWVVDKVNTIKYDRNHTQFLEFCHVVTDWTKKQLQHTGTNDA